MVSPPKYISSTLVQGGLHPEQSSEVRRGKQLGKGTRGSEAMQVQGAGAEGRGI